MALMQNAIVLFFFVFLVQGAARIFLLTKNNFVLADQKTGQVKASVALPDLASISVSTQNDGFFALKLKEVGGTLVRPERFLLAAVAPQLIQSRSLSCGETN